MSEITLEQAKQHLRVDHDEEDDYIASLIDTAELHAANYLNAPEGLLENMFDSNGAPAPVISAVLLLVGDLYANRESQGDRQLYLNDTFKRLLDPYRLMGA